MRRTEFVSQCVFQNANSSLLLKHELATSSPSAFIGNKADVLISNFFSYVFLNWFQTLDERKGVIYRFLETQVSRCFVRAHLVTLLCESKQGHSVRNMELRKNMWMFQFVSVMFSEPC